MKKIVKSKTAFILSVTIGYFLFFFSPIEQYVNSIDDFIFDIWDLLLIMIPVFLAFLVVITIFFNLFSLLGKKANAIIISLVFGFFIALYIQGTFFSSELNILDGQEFLWNSRQSRFISLIIWTIIPVLSILLSFLKETKYEKIVSSVSGFVLAMLVISSVLICITGNGFKNKTSFSVTDDHILDMSKDTNFVVLVLDTAEGAKLNSSLPDHPEYRDWFEDFTFFENTMGTYPGTKWSIPYMLSGEWFEWQSSFSDYLEDAYTSSEFFSNLKQDGYSIGLYEPDLPQIDDFLGFCVNVLPAKSLGFEHPFEFIKMQLMLTGLKYAPYDLKRFCYLTPDNIYYDSLKKTGSSNAYSWRNDDFLKLLESSEIQEDNRKAFRFIHLSGAHYPYEDNEYINGIPWPDASYDSSLEACLEVTRYYFDELKAAGLWDNTIIVVLGDHGFTDPVYFRQNPVMMIKGLNEHHSFDVSSAPMSFEDLQTIYSGLMDGNPSTFFVSMNAERKSQRRFLSPYVIDDTHIVEYYQTGHAADNCTLLESGVVYSP